MYKKLKKRVISILLAAAMTVSCMPLSANADVAQSTIEVNANAGNATVETPSVADADTEVTVNVTPTENNYIKSVSLYADGGSKEWNTESYVDNGNGTYRGTFNTASTRTAYTLDVFSAPVLEWNNTSVSINYNNKTSREAAEADILKNLDVAEGIDKSKLRVEYLAKEKRVTDEKWQAIGVGAPVTGHAFGEKSKEKIRIFYDYDSALPKYPNATIQLDISVADTRVTPIVNVKSDVTIGYSGKTITKADVVKQVFESVTYNGATVLDEVTDLVSISEESKVWAYKKDADGNYTKEIKDEIGKELSSIVNGDIVGEYKVIVQYAGNRDYKAATQIAYFSVYDNRSTTSIKTQDAVMGETNLGNISYSSSKLVEILVRKVTDGTGAVLSKNDVIITSIECISAGYESIIKEAPLTEIGVYEIYFEYPDTKTHKKATTRATIVIDDDRPTAVLNLKSDVQLPYTEANPLTEEGIYTAVLESVMAGETNVDLAYDAENVSLTDKDGTSIEASAITEPGTYAIKIKVNDTNTYKGTEKTEEFKVVDGRKVPVLNLKQDANVVYKGKKYTEQELLSAVFESLTNAEGVVIKTENMTATATADVLNVGAYEITVEFGGNADYKPTSATITLTVVKADQTAPSGLDYRAETIDQKADGYIKNLTTAMEYRKDKEKVYTAVTGTELTGLADGTYYIRYKEDSDHNASADTPIVLSNDKKLNVTVPEIQIGYTLTVDKDKLVWKDSVELTFVLSDGYSKLNTFAVNVNGNPVELDKDGKYTVTNVQTDVVITVEGVADVTVPELEITLGEKKWNMFCSSIIFDLFFKDTQTVTITAEDKGSGVDKISYHLAETELTEAEIMALADSDWTEYTDAYNLNPQDEYIIYAKATDKAGNTKYISSDKGIIIDSIAPVIIGIANGETHYGDTTFAISDKHLDHVTVDGDPITLTDGKYTITADGKEHTVVATDKAGNENAELKITVITIATIDDAIEKITINNVKSSDKKAIEDVLDLVNRLIASGKIFTKTEQKELDAMKANAENLLKKLSHISAEITAIGAGVKNITADNVKSNDKANLEKAKDDLKKALEDYKDNLTEDEKKNIQDEINRIEKVLETLAKNEKADAKNNSPSTGDNGNIWMWFVLLFVSSGLLGVTAYSRKKKNCE